MVAQRQAGQLREQLLSCLKGDLRGQAGCGLLQVPLSAALGQLQGVIQGREALLTVSAVEVGTGQGDFAHHRVHRARRRRSGKQETLTVGTRQGALVEQWPVPLGHQGFGDLARQLRAQGKHRLGQLLQARDGLWHVGLHSIQPIIQVCMQLLTGSGLGKGLSGFLKRDHGCQGHQGLLHRWGERESFLATLPQWGPPKAYSSELCNAPFHIGWVIFRPCPCSEGF